MPILSFRRYAEMSEPERLRRMGELIATAVTGYYRVQRSQQVPRRTNKSESPAAAEPAELVTDEIEKQMLGYLARVGAATPRDFRITLGVSLATVTRRLARLRAAGILSVVGRKRSVRYQLAVAGDSRVI